MMGRLSESHWSLRRLPEAGRFDAVGPLPSRDLADSMRPIGAEALF